MLDSITHLLAAVHGGQPDFDFCRRLRDIPVFRKLYRGVAGLDEYVATLEDCLTVLSKDTPAQRAAR